MKRMMGRIAIFGKWLKRHGLRGSKYGLKTGAHTKHNQPTEKGVRQMSGIKKTDYISVLDYYPGTSYLGEFLIFNCLAR